MQIYQDIKTDYEEDKEYNKTIDHNNARKASIYNLRPLNKSVFYGISKYKLMDAEKFYHLNFFDVTDGWSSLNITTNI